MTTESCARLRRSLIDVQVSRPLPQLARKWKPVEIARSGEQQITVVILWAH
jgi:hypothetical protein